MNIVQPDYPTIDPNTISYAGLKYLVLHHTAGTVAESPSHGESLCESIDRDHRNSRGWAAIGYNFVVGAGAAYYGRSWIRRNGANYDSEWNPISISICWLGHADDDVPSAADKAKILELADWVEDEVRRRGGPATLARRSHRDEPGVTKSCSGRNLYDWWRSTSHGQGGAGSSAGDFTVHVEGSGDVPMRMITPASPIMKGEDVRAIQALLALRGHDPGTVDGQYGPASQAACRQCQASCGLAQDAWVGSKTLDVLLNG